MAWPEIIAAAGGEGERAGGAISSGGGERGSGTPLVESARIAAWLRPEVRDSAAITRSIRLPSTAPGQMALTRMFQRPTSMASDLVRPITPPLGAGRGG